MDERQLKKFKTSFTFFWIGQILFLISMFTFEGRFKFLPSWLILLAVFGYIGFVVMMIGIFIGRGINKEFYYSLVTCIIFIGVTVLKSVCETSTDDFYINWSKGLEWSIQALKCLFYFYFFYGCYKYFVSLGHSEIGKKSKIAAIIFVSLFILERLTVFLMFFNGIKANIVANRIFTFGQMIVNFVIYVYLVVITTFIFIRLNKRRKEALEHEEAK